MMNDAYAKAENILKEHMAKLHEVAKTLFLQEKLSGEEFAELMEKPVQPVIAEASASDAETLAQAEQAVLTQETENPQEDSSKTEPSKDDDTPAPQE